jgi:hypothetical protein
MSSQVLLSRRVATPSGTFGLIHQEPSALLTKGNPLFKFLISGRGSMTSSNFLLRQIDCRLSHRCAVVRGWYVLSEDSKVYSLRVVNSVSLCEEAVRVMFGSLEPEFAGV